MSGRGPKLGLLAAFIMVATVTVLAYLPGMSAGFYFDDEPNIVRAEALHWQELGAAHIRNTLDDAAMPSRPVANLSFALNYLADGLDPAPYHRVNLAIHLAVGLALLWVIRLIQRQHGDDHGNEWLALTVVFLFLVHPLNIQAVTYVVQRMTSLATLFFLLGFGSYLRGRYAQQTGARIRWMTFAALALLAAAGSKEIGLLLIPFLLLYEICFHFKDWQQWYADRASPFARLLAGAAVAVSALALAAVAWKIAEGAVFWQETMPGRDFTGYERVLTQGRVQFFYLSLLLWPATSRLNLDHEFAVSTSLFDPLSTGLALLVWLAIMIIAVRMVSASPRFAFPLLAYMLLHSIEAGPINLELVFEHRMYLPMTMLALLLAQFSLPRVTMYRRTCLGAILAVGVALAFVTHERNDVWGKPLEFHQDIAQKSPNKWRPSYNLGTLYGQKGMVVEAREALEQAVKIRPEDSETHNQLANVYVMSKQFRSAEYHYRQAIKYRPSNAEALYNLSLLFSSQGRLGEQREVLRKFVEHAPPYLEQQKQRALEQLGE